MNQFQNIITNIYENNPLSYTAMIWVLGAVTSALAVYLVMR